MARRLLKDKLIKREDIDEDLFLLEESNTDYITKTGKIYKDYENGYFLPKQTFINKANGYVYINITNKDNRNVSRRLHILLAKTFIPNPNNYNVVGHLDNNKSNYELSNLYWTNTSENTQKAYDGLEINDKSINDSQSHQIACYTENGQLISVYGSISEAGRCIVELDKQKVYGMLKTTYSRKYHIRFKRITKEEYYKSPIKDLCFSISEYQ